MEPRGVHLAGVSSTGGPRFHTPALIHNPPRRRPGPLRPGQAVLLSLGPAAGLLRDVPGAPLRVDFCVAAAGLVVEVDGARWHPDAARDQARDDALVALGRRVLRFGWGQVVHDHEAVVQQVQAALAGGTPTIQLRDGGRPAAA